MDNEIVEAVNYLKNLKPIKECEHALQPFKDEREAILKVLEIDDTDHLVNEILKLKKSKVIQAPKPITFWEKLKFLLD